MRRIFTLAALAAVTMTSCSKNEASQSTIESKAIGFSTYVGSATKAGDVTSFINDAKFTVDAYHTEAEVFASASKFDPFMQDQDVTAAVTIEGETTTVKWSYSPVKYWPNDKGDKVSFFAASNGTDTSVPFEVLTADKEASVKYSATSADADFLVASKLNATESDAAVKLSFKHALSKVSFNAMLAEKLADETVVTLTDMKITPATGYKTEGTFKFSKTDESAGTWAIDNTSTSTLAAISKTGLNKVLAEYESTPATPYEPFYSMQLLPQGDGTASLATVEFTYTVATTAADAANSSTVTNTATFEINKLAMNTIYTYNIIISLTGVEIEGEMGSWDSATVENFFVDVETSTDKSPVEDTFEATK